MTTRTNSSTVTQVQSARILMFVEDGEWSISSPQPRTELSVAASPRLSTMKTARGNG